MDAGAAAIIQMLMTARRNSTCITTPEPETLKDFGLGDVECEICGNKGYILTVRDDGVLMTEECYCMKKRRSLRSIRTSGLSDMLERYTFENYKTPDAKREGVLQIAKEYCKTNKSWFYISGQSGSGKSHICTAICGELISQGNSVKYMLWRDEITQLKAGTLDRKWYEETINRLKTVPVLYIDDFLKGKVTDADINMAFEIINFRYNDAAKRTIISSELQLPKIMELDEATGGRIYERSKGFVVSAPTENWRLRE